MPATWGVISSRGQSHSGSSGGQGLAREHVQRHAREAPLVKLGGQRGLVDGAAPAHVDDEGVLRQQPEPPVVQYVPRLRGAGQGHDQQVGLRQDVVQPVDGMGGVEHRPRIAAPPVHAGDGTRPEGAKPHGDLPADVAGAQQRGAAIPDGAHGQIPPPAARRTTSVYSIWRRISISVTITMCSAMVTP